MHAILHMKSFKRLYIVAVSTIVLLVLASQLLIQHSINKQAKDALIINLAGKQRMLSQNITKTALMYTQPNQSRAAREPLKEELARLLNSWKEVHAGLQYGDEKLGLPGENSSEVEALFANIQPHFSFMYKAGLST